MLVRLRIVGSALLSALCALLLPAPLLFAQTAATPLPATAAQDASPGPAFEVAAVRQANTNDGRHWTGVDLTPSGRVTISAMSLKSLVGFCYLAKPGTVLVADGSDWIESQLWDITAKVDDAVVAAWANASDKDRMETIRPMLRTLLEERFQLKLHKETKVVSAYSLVQAKGGAKLKEVDPPPANEDPQKEDERLRSGKMDDGPPPGGFSMGGGKWVGHALQIGLLATEIQANARLDGPLVDQTGLNGYYDFTFSQSQDADAPPLLDQIEMQLGLTVEPKKIPMTMYVIDSADKPSEN